MGLIAVGGFAVTWNPGHGFEAIRGPILVLGACLAWAVDNNLTRNIAGGDPIVIAAVKGGAAGAANLAIALAGGAARPDAPSAIVAAVIGFLGYGVSLTLFVRALRELGTARTGAYFSTAPFLGAAASVVALGEPLTLRLAAGGVVMGVGVWLHVSERHAHQHVHDRLEHEHLHRHDDHHRHDHEPGTPDGEPHSHRHTHGALRHAHSHYPDLHHRHGHRAADTIDP